MNEKTLKQRLDQLLLDLGLCESRTQAQALIRAGEVLVAEQKIDKPGTMVPAESPIRLLNQSRDVSRGAEKLRTAFERFPIEAQGLMAADLGASTGGFTQVLLEQGAREVHAFDVGRGLLHNRLATDRRVVQHERCNVRYLTGEEMPPAEIVTMDLSFIGLELILPAIHRIRAETMCALALVKPQFEAGRGQVGKKGVVRDPKVIIDVLRRHLQTLHTHGYRCCGLVPSQLVGRKGNQEFLSWFIPQDNPPSSAPILDDSLPADLLQLF